MYQINNVTYIPDGEKVTIRLIDSQWETTIEKARNHYRYQQNLLKNPLQNGDVTDKTDRCPQHNLPLKKEYCFGALDAWVYTFKGCKCAVCDTGFGGHRTYHPTYEQAQSKATLRKALNAVW